MNDIQLNQEENLSNLSCSIYYGSNDYLHADSYLSIERSISNETNQQPTLTQMKFIDKDIYQSTINSDTITTNLVNTHIPYSSLFWPRKGQTLDNYIREYDSQTRTDVEKV